MTLTAGQNAWSTLGIPTPNMPKTSVPRAGDHSVPAIHLIKLPFELKPIVPNSVISGFKLHDQGFTDGPVLQMFDNSGHHLTTDLEMGDLNTGELALPDILNQLGIIKKPELSSDSYINSEQILQFRPKQFIGQYVYKYWSDADPPGTYRGTIVSYESRKDIGQLWKIFWPEIGNNAPCSEEFEFADMVEYCTAL